jgi:hypothetical protein
VLTLAAFVAGALVSDVDDGRSERGWILQVGGHVVNRRTGRAAATGDDERPFTYECHSGNTAIEMSPIHCR